jgi:phosphoribosylformimino-5-aminoimidazole carboxamide ribotide isomerase
MRIYPVLDLKGGLVVRGVAGERHLYRPVTSSLTASARPLAVARAFRERFGFRRLYLADLDAIAGGTPAAAVYRELLEDGFELLADAGLRSGGGAIALRELGVAGIIAALETIPAPAVLGEVCEVVGAAALVFSIDLTAGRPLGDAAAWPAEPAAIAREACARGVERLLLLDLAAVGAGGGPAQLELIERLRRELPEVELLTGGGVRGPADLELLESLGVSGVLVASALHDGRLGPSELARFGG